MSPSALTADEHAELFALDPRIVDEATLYAGGIGHVRKWLAAGKPTADLDALDYAGDERIGAVVLDVLRQVPAPVAHHIVTSAVIVGVGIDSLGWVDRYPEAPQGASRVVLGCAGPGIIAHELAHVQHMQPLPKNAPRSKRERLQLLEKCMVDITGTAVANGDTEDLVEFMLEPERMADAAASLWLGEVINTCTGRRLQNIMATIQRRASSKP